jgi:hypothetical protein
MSREALLDDVEDPCRGVTLRLKFFAMMSHLPEPVLASLKSLVLGLDEGLQADSHKVAKAIAVDGAFDHKYIDSGLTRALIYSNVKRVAVSGVEIVPLGNGGCEAAILHDRVERRFRFKKAMYDQRGALSVTVSSDSLLTHIAKQPNLFDTSTEPAAEERWVLPYLLDPVTRTLREIWAALPTHVLGRNPPYRLAFGPVFRLPLGSPAPRAFPTRDEDLELPDEEEEDRGDEKSG